MSESSKVGKQLAGVVSKRDEGVAREALRDKVRFARQREEGSKTNRWRKDGDVRVGAGQFPRRFISGRTGFSLARPALRSYSV